MVWSSSRAHTRRGLLRGGGPPIQCVPSRLSQCRVTGIPSGDVYFGPRGVQVTLNSTDPAPLFLNEGFSMDHVGNIIMTWHVDFRSPEERSPIGPLVKYGEARYAIDRSRTIQLTRPPYFRKEGETLIHDTGEGLVSRKTVVRRETPVKGPRLRALKEAAETAGLALTRITATETDTMTDTDTYTWGEDYWLYCTAMEPTSDAEHKALLASLDPDYRHGSYIPSARTFAQMLGRAYVEADGPPDDELKPMNHTLDDGTKGTTYHRQMLVVHGPVVYVDDPYAVATAALKSRYDMKKVLLPMLTKDMERIGQREYRFLIIDKRQPQATSKVIPATPELLAAVGQPGASRGPMHVQDFRLANQGETTE